MRSPKLPIMRAALLVFTVFGAMASFAQAPYQFNFQAVARNLAGNPITNQSVDFRIGIVAGSPEGSVVYQETHNVTTNQFGLTNIAVGAGQNTTGELSAVDWANGPYFIRIELDINQSGDFVLSGEAPLLSVPYALYALSSGSSGSGSGFGASLPYPDGTMIGDTVITQLSSAPYTVPDGVNFYIQNYYSLSSGGTLSINGIVVFRGFSNYGAQDDNMQLSLPLYLKPGDVVSSSDNGTSISGIYCSPGVEPVTHGFGSAYTVPAGKRLIVGNLYSLSSGASFEIDGRRVAYNFFNYGAAARNQHLEQPIVISGGKVFNCTAAGTSFNGYLIDID